MRREKQAVSSLVHMTPSSTPKIAECFSFNVRLQNTSQEKHMLLILLLVHKSGKLSVPGVIVSI